MKRILFPSILIGTVLAGGVLAYSIWKASPVTSQQYFESGKKYYEQEDYPEAFVQFLNAIEKDPRNRDAHYFLALTYANQKNVNAAAAQFMALLEYFPDDVPANLELGNIYLTGGRADPAYFRQANEIAQKVLAKEPQNSAALILSGNALAGLQDYRSSVELFEKAIGFDSQNISAFVSLGTARALQKNYPEAEQAFLKARAINPRDKSVLISLANYYLAVRESSKAEAVFKEALSIYPSDKEIYLPAVEGYYQAGRVEQAQNVLRDAQANNSKDPEPSLVLADLYAANNRTADAQKLLMELKQEFPGNVAVAAKLAANLIQDQPEQARREIDEILKNERRNVLGHILLGEIQFKSGEIDAAEATFGTDPAVNSSYPQPHFFLGNIAAKKGRMDEAQDHFQKSLLVNNGYLPAKAALAELFLNNGRLADCREEIRQVLSAQPSFVPARIIKAALDTTEKNYPEAERELNSLLKEQPDNAMVHRQIGLYYDSRGRTSEAEKSLMRAIQLQPNSEEILRDVIQFYIRRKQTEQAIRTINNVPDDKKQAVHFELMGLTYFQAGKLQDSENAYKKAREKDPARTSSDVYLAVQYIQSGRLDEAQNALDQLIKKNPTNANAIAMKGLINENQGKVEEAKQNYNQALKIDPNYDPAANNLAYMLAEEGRDLETALGWARNARKRQPESPSAADTLGWVYYKLGNHVLARDQLKFAVSREPDNAVFQYHLAMIFRQTKQINEAQTALRKAVNNPKAFKEKPLAEAALKEIANLK